MSQQPAPELNYKVCDFYFAVAFIHGFRVKICFTLKVICTTASNAVSTLHKLRQLRDNLKNAVNTTDVSLFSEQKEEAKALCAHFNAQFELINRTKSCQLVRRRISRRAKMKNKSNDVFYATQMDELLSAGKDAFGAPLNTKTSIKSSSEKESIATGSAQLVDDDNRELTHLEAKIDELKQLKERIVCLVKLVKLGSNQRASAADDHQSHTSLNELQALSALVDTRLGEYESERRSIRHRHKATRRACNANSAQLVDVEWHDRLDQLEADIRHDLFECCVSGPSCSTSGGANQSIDELISVRTEWDYFISESKGAQSVPIEWVEPNTRPNQEWSQYLHA